MRKKRQIFCCLIFAFPFVFAATTIVPAERQLQMELPLCFCCSIKDRYQLKLGVGFVSQYGELGKGGIRKRQQFGFVWFQMPPRMSVSACIRPVRLPVL